MSSTKGAVCYNYITVVDKAKPNGAGKKLLIPPTMAAFRKSAAKALNWDADKTVQAIYTPNGEKIKSVNDIIPNTKVLVSSEINDDELASAAQMMASAQQVSSPTRGPLPPAYPSPSMGSQLGNLSALRNQSNLGSVNLSQLNITGGGLTSRPQSTLQSGGGFRPPSTLQSRPGSRSPSSLMIVVNDDTSTQGSRLRKRKGTEFAISDDDQFEVEENDNKRFSKSGISHRAIESLLSFLPAEIALSSDGTASIVKALSPLVARFSSNVRNVQFMQEAHLYKHITQSLLNIPKHSPLLDERAAELVNNATFGSSCGAYTRFKAAVVGPPQSGKSTFLQILASFTLLRMMGSGQYKRTLFFMVDFRSFSESINHPINFYQEFVKIIFEAIANQKIEFRPYCDSVIHHFQRITKLDKLPVLPQKFTICDEFRAASIILGEICQNIFNCLHKIHSLSVFLTHCAMLPRYIAFAFGFTGVHFVIDHFDASDIDILADSPLDDDPHSLSLIDYIKFMVSNDSFVISCSNEERLVESLELVSDDGVDIRDGTDFISITDMDDEHSDTYEFMLACEDIQDPVKLRLIDCGGCSGFLAKWDVIIDLAQQMQLENDKNSNSRDYKEVKLTLLSKLREFAPLVLKKYRHEDSSVVPLTNKIRDFVINETEQH
ncbi:hypothetical protein TRFO_27504 [Tritrichomonas foetus]|uniref:Uncharacterized protein n=1 Tax=Tritrichomonas foetus TaxID=1144522 RepID=A0A1J4K5A0_9EUKA|nr:hypothetical protein TRFO_27504 [Tritrichomonas foetus]|eukprot:OHT04892.1 hypothetical protein TRFO_27504 [Tritrichomonas foetus]